MRDYASVTKTSGNVFRSHISRIRCARYQEEFDISDRVDVCPDERVDFFADSALEWAEKADIKWPSYVGGIRWKASRDNIVVFAVRFKLDRLMALVSVEQ